MPHSQQILRTRALTHGISSKTSTQDSGMRCAFVGWLLYVPSFLHRLTLVSFDSELIILFQQPTAFTLSTYTLPEILEDRALLSAISLYSSSQLATSPPQAATTPRRLGGRSGVADSEPGADSVLFLRISAAADYFSLEQSLMEDVPPVLADVILDPFLGNVFPKSLVPTACWISVVACLAIVVARWISREFTRVVNSTDIRDHQDVKKGQ